MIARYCRAVLIIGPFLIPEIAPAKCADFQRFHPRRGIAFQIRQDLAADKIHIIPTLLKYFLNFKVPIPGYLLVVVDRADKITVRNSKACIYGERSTLPRFKQISKKNGGKTGLDLFYYFWGRVG
jgi:hypothetical protein